MTDIADAVDELEALVKAATPGPWRHFASDRKLAKGGRQIDAIFGPDREDGRSGIDRVVHWAGFDSANETGARKRANAALIVAAVNALPTLLAQASDAARLAREVERLRAFVRCIAENESDPKEPVADNGGTVWDLVRHDARRLVKPPPLTEADKVALGNILSDALAQAGVK